MILAGTGWQGMGRGMAICQGSTGTFKGAEPSSTKRLPLWSLLRASRILTLLWLMTQAVSLLSQPPIPLLPPQPEAGLQCDPWTKDSRPRSYMDCAEHNTLSQPLLQIPKKSLLRYLKTSTFQSVIHSGQEKSLPLVIRVSEKKVWNQHKSITNGTKTTRSTYPMD